MRATTARASRSSATTSGTCTPRTHFFERGIVKPPLFIQSVFGILGGIGPHPDDVAHMKRTADRLFGDQYRWSVLGAGRNQLPIAAMSAAMGGNVRVGLEDSLWLGPGKLAESNAAQVRAVRQIIEGLGLEIATPDEARRILALKGARERRVLTSPPGGAGRLARGQSDARPRRNATSRRRRPTSGRGGERLPWVRISSRYCAFRAARDERVVQRPSIGI